METTYGISTHTKLVGSLRFVLTNDSNQNRVHIIPGCGYDPDSLLNILSVSTLGKFFNDNADPNDKFGNDGRAVKSCVNRLPLVWDHDKHKRHFLLGSSRLPELCLYV